MDAVTEKFKSINWANNAYAIGYWNDEKVSLIVQDLEVDGISNNSTRLELFFGGERKAFSIWPDGGDSWVEGDFSEIPKSHKFEDVYGKPAGANCTVSFGINTYRGLGRWQFLVREIVISKYAIKGVRAL